jgi:RNA polymerase sigma-70 factor (ECF subfamily)
MTSPPAQSDNELISRVVARGDQFAFSELVKRHQSTLRASLRKMTHGHVELADDIAQETFILAWKNIAKFRYEAKFSTWLYRITFNLCIDQKRRPVAGPLDDTIDPPDPAEPVDERIARAQTEAAVAQAVSALPDRQRDAVALTYQGGLSNQEAATALGVSVGSLESLLVRARRTLRAALGGHGGT